MKAFLTPRWVPAVLLVLIVLFFWRPELATLAAGIALFMLGMHHLEDGFRAFTGGALERWLSRSTNRMWKSLLFGVVSTALVQSSSLVTLLTIAFLSAGLVSLIAGIGIVFGANLGTTTGAWLIALVGLKIDLAAVAMPLLVFGVMLGRRVEAVWKGLGQVLLGIGLLFLGIDLMKAGFESFEGVLNLEHYQLSGWTGVLVYTFIGLLATVLMQSSHASMMITLAALASGQLAYGNALAMAIGANLGTTVTAVIGAMGSNNAGRRLAGAHILFNLVTAVVALVILPSLTRVVEDLSAWLGIAADAHTLKLALFHTLFNVLGLAIMLPFVPLMVKYLMRWLPDVAAVDPAHPDLSEQPPMRAHYLNDSSLLHADAALKVLDQEVRHLAELSREVIGSALYLPDLKAGLNNEQLLARLQAPVPMDERVEADVLYERHVKGVYGDIIDFISRLDTSLLPEQQQQLMDYSLAARDLVESVKAAKHLQANLRRQIDSAQPTIRNAYDRLRWQCIQAMKSLDALAVVGDGMDTRRLAFADYERLEKQFADTFQREVQSALRNREMDGWQASSLLNDLHYLLRIQRHLGLAYAALDEVAALAAATDKPVEKSPADRERVEPTVDA
ncbi:Na/Pi cotransporter family protein [Halopseudomonas salegens]|uniref:Phosphate:Na+ symporter n=1 Tax=Halopseudomonas salegens TaxID=1434072 RepID=A0A1H2I1A4_9GAMM|nr:Na/Pi symporter [Halopseudomonas salegens]SDU37745.1 phosphate:Na+ symporter [Halopseudomonas salegens]